MNYLLAILTSILSVASWSEPQPQYSMGLLVTYGNQQLVEANADWRSYDLSLYPNRCGFSAISPAHLGRIAWIRTDGHRWVGPCISVDAVSRRHAYDSIYVRHEIGEVSRDTAAMLGFEYGAQGYVYFGQCPPIGDDDVTPQEYAPPLTWDYPPTDWTPSFYPYPLQEKVIVDCNRRPLPAGHVEYE